MLLCQRDVSHSHKFTFNSSSRSFDRHSLQNKLKSNGAPKSFGNSFVRGLRAAATIAAPDLIIHQILLDSDDDNSNRQAIQALKETQLQFIFLIALSQKTHDDVMTEAVRMGVAGTGVHNWVFSDLFLLTVQGRLFEQNSPLHKAYSGVGMLKASGTAGPKFDDFSKKLKLVKNPDDFEYLNAMVPGFNQTSFTNRDTFLDPLSYDFTAFFYEATVLVGMSACAAVADAGSGDNLTLTGDTLYDHMLKLPSFDGVTGNVKLDPWTGSRLPSSAFYEVTNFVQQEVVDPDSGKTMIMFKQVLTDVYYNGTWVNKNSFVFNDGTTNLPYGIPQPSPVQQYVNPAVRALAYTFYAVAIILAAWFGFWTYRNRETRVVKASQPFFLYLICGGCVIYATTIIALSFDSRNTSIGGCSIACTLSMWLLFVGFTFIFSALFAKTHRINKIMKNAKQFRRVKVTVRDTLKPVIVLLTRKYRIPSFNRCASWTICYFWSLSFSPYPPFFNINSERNPLDTHDSFVPSRLRHFRRVHGRFRPTQRDLWQL